MSALAFALCRSFLIVFAETVSCALATHGIKAVEVGPVSLFAAILFFSFVLSTPEPCTDPGRSAWQQAFE